ncbi:hypothetical protein LA080_003650 [Diaporthe eres]|nr:hypothetical protein LA080_003650 [Diaporthe eres]
MQPKEIHSRSEQVTTNEADSTGRADHLFAKLSREQLEAMNKDLKSKVERLEKQSAANFSPWAKCSEKPSALEDLVKKASGTLDLVKAGIDLRKENDQVHDGETLLEQNTKLRADLEASQQETARVKGWLNSGEVEITTRFPDIDFIRKSTMKLNGVRVPESPEDETRLEPVGSNSVQNRKHAKS